MQRTNAYERYRQPAPRRRRRRRRRAGRTLTWLLILVLIAAAAGWFLYGWYQDKLLRETLKTYPLAHRELIQRYAVSEGLEPAYMAAIIMSESSFRTDATSNVNAQGLMQIMPETGEWIAGKFGETYTDGCLYDPETNVKYGCWYMGFLIDRYNGDKACASAAYHSGQGTVDGWLQNPEYSADGRTLTVIPGENANTYVERVLRYYEKYKEIYGVGLTEHAETH